MLPPRASPPEDATKLDYSIAMEYEGPPVSYEVPKVEPLDVNSRAIPIAEPLSSESQTHISMGPPISIPLPVEVGGGESGGFDGLGWVEVVGCGFDGLI
nr:extra-large guanine nucleotide-binding protein 3 [Quercus suber]